MYYIGMAILRKNKDDEEDYEDENEEEEYRSKRTNRKIRDLNPQNKKRRKEPPKPWGKRERLVVLIILLITAGTSGILYLSSRAWKLPGIPRIKLPSFSLPFSGQETIVIEGDKKNLELQKKKEEVVTYFIQKTKDLTGVYGLYVIDLNTGFSYGVNESDQFEPASLNKLAVMAAIFIEEEAGNIDLESKYKLKNEDKVTGAGSLSAQAQGYEITYRNLIRLMGKQSDNTAFNILRKTLGEETINKTLEKIGMESTSLTENRTTPKDIGRFFEELWNGNLISNEHKDELLGYLTDTLYEEWIAAGVPDEVRVAHKFGRETNIVNDAGIVFSEKLSEPGGSPSRRPFILVLMSKGVVEREADTIYPELARFVYGVQI